jgi:predicted cobalt transporter CbtA
MPVHRAPGKRSAVSASRLDIERWKKGKGRNTRNKIVGRYFICVTIGHAVMLAIFLSWWFSRG